MLATATRSAMRKTVEFTEQRLERALHLVRRSSCVCDISRDLSWEVTFRSVAPFHHSGDVSWWEGWDSQRWMSELCGLNEDNALIVLEARACLWSAQGLRCVLFVDHLRGVTLAHFSLASMALRALLHVNEVNEVLLRRKKRAPHHFVVSSSSGDDTTPCSKMTERRRLHVRPC